MGLDVFEIVFWWVGKVFWLRLSKIRRKTTTLSDGTYEVLGFIIFLLFIVLVFFYWSL
jgi:hypothetical protein